MIFQDLQVDIHNHGGQLFASSNNMSKKMVVIKKIAMQTEMCTPGNSSFFLFLCLLNRPKGNGIAFATVGSASVFLSRRTARHAIICTQVNVHLGKDK